MKNRKKIFLPLLFVMCLFLMAVPVNASSKYKSEWVTGPNGKYVYFDENGKKVTGMQKIGKNYYFFDRYGIQKTGWIKINNDYYCFRIDKGARGYRLNSRVINGITLRANGKAKLNSYSRRKLALMLRASQVVQKITNEKMTKQEKLRKAFDYAKNNLRARNRGGFQKSGSWDIFYAEIPFNSGNADCYSYAAYFAYLANAIGYKATVVSSGGHGWAEIDGKVYDPNWAKYSKVDSYFGMPYRLSGVGGRPRYKQNRAFLKTI